METVQTWVENRRSGPSFNPCKRMPRCKRSAKERFLTPAEYGVLDRALHAEAAKRPTTLRSSACYC